jgi:hypothetical protein
VAFLSKIWYALSSFDSPGGQFERQNRVNLGLRQLAEIKPAGLRNYFVVSGIPFKIVKCRICKITIRAKES